MRRDNGAVWFFSSDPLAGPMPPTTFTSVRREIALCLAARALRLPGIGGLDHQKAVGYSEGWKMPERRSSDEWEHIDLVGSEHDFETVYEIARGLARDRLGLEIPEHPDGWEWQGGLPPTLNTEEWFSILKEAVEVLKSRR